MLNIIKMDLYRMLKTKSMYVIWIVLAAILLITTSLSKTDYELLTEKDVMKQEQVTEPTVDNINVGMMVTLPTEPGEKVTVYDIFCQFPRKIVCTAFGDFYCSVFNSGYQ